MIRAKIVLLAAEGMDNVDIAARLDTTRTMMDLLLGRTPCMVVGCRCPSPEHDRVYREGTHSAMLLDEDPAGSSSAAISQTRLPATE